MRRHASLVSPLAASTPYTVEHIDRAQDFLALEPIWRDLSDQSVHPCAFATWEWANSWWRIFLSGGETCLHIFVVRDRTGLVQGIVPLYGVSSLPEYLRQAPPSSTGGRWLKTREWRPLGFLGGDAQTLTEEPIFLAQRGSELAVRDALIQHFGGAGGAGGDWDYAKFHFQREAEAAAQSPPTASALSVGVHGAVHISTRVKESSALLDLPADWPTLRGRLSRSMRDNLSYYPRLLQRHGHTFQCRFLRTECEVMEGVATLIALHRHRARNEHGGQPHVNHVPDALRAAFLEQCLPRLAQRGSAFLAMLEVSGEAIAAQAFLEYRNVLTFYYSGFRTDWHMYSPLLILAQEVLADALRRDVQRVNFLPRAAAWKARWGAEPTLFLCEVRANRLTSASLVRSGVTLAHREIARRQRIRQEQQRIKQGTHTDQSESEQRAK